MTTFQSGKKKFFGLKITVFVVVAILIVFFLGKTSLIPRLGGVSLAIAKPFFAVGNFFGESGKNISIIFKNKTSLEKKVNVLKTELALRDAKLLNMSMIENENISLKNDLGRTPSQKEILFGKVLIKPNRSPYDTLIIDVGSEDGVLSEQKVFGNGDIYIGNISQVYKNSSKVVLFSSPSVSTFSRFIKNGIDVELQGRGGGGFSIELAKEVLVEEGDIVAIPDESDQIVAIISSLATDPRDPYQTIFLKSPVNFNELQYVFIEK